MLIRVRSNVGVWRVDGLDKDTATVQDVLNGIAATRPDVVYEGPGLCRDPACKQVLDESQPLSKQGLGHGSMIHCRVDPTTCVDISAAAPNADAAPTDAAGTSVPVHRKRIIDKDGSIRLVESSDPRLSEEDKGFRKGMMALRDMKMAWTLNEFMELDSKYTFKIARQETAICQQVSLDSACIGDFQAYLQRFAFNRKYMGFLYGKYVKDEEDKSRVIVEAIYEPPQEIDKDSAEGFVLLEDPLEETVDQIAQMCGLRKVGWIFGHEPREDVVLTSAEVLMAADFQLEAADGVNETPFCTVKVTRGSDGVVSVEAFQVSQQCMAMAAEEALEVDGEDLKVCKVHETFTAIQEGKESPTVDNNFFLCVVPIAQHKSDSFVSMFPKMNRDLDDRTPSHDEMKKQLSKSGSAGWTFIDLLADFNLLIYLSKFLDMNADFPRITQAIADRSVPLDDGYKIIIASMAGLDNAY